MASVISAQDLSKTYKIGRDRVRALAGVTFEIQQNKVTGLIGPNGAGKSTFIKLLLGYIVPTSGQLSAFGFEPGVPAALEKIGYLPENPRFPEYLSGREILTYVAKLHHRQRSISRSEIDDLLDSVGILHAAKRRVRSYSKGMAQRLGLAQALIAKPNLLILDEPMSGLDPVGRAQIKRLLREQADEGASVVFCSHILDDVENLCDNVVMLAKGGVVFDGTVPQLLNLDVQGRNVVLRATEKPAIHMADWQQFGPDAWQAKGLSEEQVKAVIKAAASEEVTIESIRGNNDMEALFVRLSDGHTAL